MKKAISITAVALSVLMLFSGCKGSDSKKQDNSGANDLSKTTINATIVLEDGDEISLELYPDIAPKTVANFVELAEDGFYDGTIFHRVIEDFVIQGGGYDENLKAKKAPSIKGEFAENGFENTLSHTRGVISMARAQDKDSATSQFFIVQQDATHLDGKFAAFGKVTDGMDVVDEIASVKTGSVASAWLEDVPVEPIVIRTITIDDGSSNSSKNGKSSKSTAKPTTSPKATQTPKASKDTDGENEADDEEPTETVDPNTSGIEGLPVVSGVTS